MVRTIEALQQLLWPQEKVAFRHRNTTFVYKKEKIYYLAKYKQSGIQILIKRTKYQGNKKSARQLAEVLDSYLDRVSGEMIIIPMPISYRRWRTRGYNHIELICQQSRYAGRVQTGILKKVIDTPQQTRVTKSVRVNQQPGTFAVSSKLSTISTATTIILLDDVCTTGSTMKAARTCLSNALPQDCQLLCVALAH